MNEPTPPRWLAPLLIVLLAVLGGSAGVLAGRAWLAPAAPASGPGFLSEGAELPALQMRDLDGQQQTLRVDDGEPVLINFWATWCPPCVRELPMLEDLHARRSEDGLKVWTIAQEEDPAAVRQFMTEHDIALPVWLDAPSEGDASLALGNRRSVLPYSLLVDGQGRILKRKAGAFSAAELREWSALARARPSTSAG